MRKVAAFIPQSSMNHNPKRRLAMPARSGGHRGGRVLALLGAALAAWPVVPAWAQTRPSGLPEAAHHAAVDPRTFPWSSVVKLFNSVGGACTGAVLAGDRVLTAAHCLYGFRTHRFLPADAIHVLIGYDRGDYRVHARVAGYTIGPGYDPVREGATAASDWAILALAAPLPAAVRPLRLSADAPASGAGLLLGGFPQDRAFAMTADAHCAVLGVDAANRLLFHNCAALPGDSGAPLLDGDPAHGFAIRAVEVGSAIRSGTRVGIAVQAGAIAPALTPPP
jgi:protease YdgD